MFTRRELLKQAGLVSLAFGGLRGLGSEVQAKDVAGQASVGFGPLQSDPEGVFDLPKGFSYRIISRAGDDMDDGLFVPGTPDGMAAFAGDDGRTILVRNHENQLEPDGTANSPFGKDSERLERFDRDLLYDPGEQRLRPGTGGTTTLVYNTREQRKLSEHLSLGGTERNCAGGPTPWGSWITCEETNVRPNDYFKLEHGYNFEVPAHATEPVKAEPLKAMGRFRHEAIAVDPDTGFVYQTEDRNDGAIYRFIPSEAGNLAKGNRLQALMIIDQPRLDTRNWEEDRTVEVGQSLAVKWIDMEDVEAPNDDLRHRAYAAGAARFARAEGMWYGEDGVYFACTTGGREQKGQIWRYVPGSNEGEGPSREAGGQLELFVEPNDHELIHNADNLTVTPWGDLLVCEDCAPPSDLLGITPQGEFYRMGRNALSGSELAGVCVSPDGSTVFVNIQHEGLTLAITGPWPEQRG